MKRGIYIYKGAVSPELFSSIKAEISFSSESLNTGIVNIKYFSPEEARKGFEALKRWISTGAFSAIVLDSFQIALSNGNNFHIIEWVEDHSTEPDFPTLLLIGDGNECVFPSCSMLVKNEEELKALI